jgi:outer membrane protein assembly factor BamB
MKRAVPLLLLFALALPACAQGPFRIARERRFADSLWLGFSSYVVAGSELATDGRTLFIGTKRGTVAAFSTPGIWKLWETDVEGSVESRPLAQGEAVYVGTSKGKLYALSAKSGLKIWEQSLNGEMVGRPAIYDGKFLLAGANDGYLYALDVKNGAVLWRYRKEFPDRITVHGFSTPAIVGSKLFAAFPDGTVAALKAEDGTELWSQRLSSDARFSDIVDPVVGTAAGPVAAQFYGTLFGLDAGGGIRWSVPNGGSAAPVVEKDGILYAPSALNRILALDARTGEEKWKFEAGGSANWSGLALSQGRVLAGSGEGILYVLDQADGKLVWRYQLGSALKGPPIVIDDSVYALTEKGVLFRLAPR